MMEHFIFGGEDIELNWERYAAMFAENTRYEVYEGRNVEFAVMVAE